MAEAPAPGETELGYGEALAELEGILDEIEDDAVDVDVLANRVRRAAELLRLCRDRISSARIEVTQIVADLDPTTGPPTGPEPLTLTPDDLDGD